MRLTVGGVEYIVKPAAWAVQYPDESCGSSTQRSAGCRKVW
jgi:hypothetical protein